MSIQNERLLSLIEFTKQCALLKHEPVKKFSQHNVFSRTEEQIRGLPGINFNCNETESNDEVWLRIDRLRETLPPIPKNKLLNIWIDLSKAPNKQPTLKTHISHQSPANIDTIDDTSTNVVSMTNVKNVAPEKWFGSLDNAKQYIIENNLQDSHEIIRNNSRYEIYLKKYLTEHKSTLISLESFHDKELLKKELKSYIEEIWKPWAEQEKEIRKSIKLYAELFGLSQDLNDAQLELFFGIGIALWTLPTDNICYPLLTKAVEVALDETTGALEIRPCSSAPQLESDIYSSINNLGITTLLEESKQFFKSTEGVLNPFDPNTFEPLLQAAATFLDSSGVYWPTQTTADDRSLPKPTENLIITDTWVLMARQRNNQMLIQDLERFEDKITNAKIDSLSDDAVWSLVTDPSSEYQEVKLPSFRGLSAVSGSGGYQGSGDSNVSELYFPLPYNDEQVQIIQKLEVYNGVVVQGPPGTGKTHTIANVICHYLANGKRVLVTSMKDPALTVLQEKIPEDIRPLTISLLNSEKDGLKQFDFAINKILDGITRIDCQAYRKEIKYIDEQINLLHSQLAKTDREITKWGHLNIKEVQIDNNNIAPADIAKEVAANRNEITWFPDNLTIDPVYKPQFGDNEIIALRKARLTVGTDLSYLDKHIPKIDSFPVSENILRAHQGLLRLNELKNEESTGTVPCLVNTDAETIQALNTAADKLSELKLLFQSINNSQKTWTISLQQYLRCHSKNKNLDLFLKLRKEILTILDNQTLFLEKPVTLADNFENNQELVNAVNNLSQGKKPFGLFGIIGKSEQKRILDKITLVASEPRSNADWAHVLKFINFKQSCKELLIRWNALAKEIPIPRLDSNPNNFTVLRDTIELYDNIVLSISKESDISNVVHSLFPSWSEAPQIPYTKEMLDNIDTVFQHYLQQHRLAKIWSLRESFLNAISECGGKIIEEISNFLNNHLGNPKYSKSDIQAEWSKNMEELRRIHSLSTYFKIIVNITGLIESSGAKQWAAQLRQEPYTGTYDALIPDNWSQTWRWCRLANFIDQIDARQDLKKLSKKRIELESNLARLYREAVNKRTWLRLTENATPASRSALEAYRTAINKIGKGTGKLAGRYRKDARTAAEQANNTIPCWIMRHERICESLPANISDFDLVIIDEASQSNLIALPAILRAKKILVVGDDKQVSPDDIGPKVEEIANLQTRYLFNQVKNYGEQMAPDRSIYDLFKVVFASSSVMLREHFRCVPPIIEYSKREFYNNELKPLRIPTASERIDPPLVDVYVTDGYRKDKTKTNLPEAKFIVDEIEKIVNDDILKTRTIGVISLLGYEQASIIWKMLNEKLEIKDIIKNKIACGDARTFQGEERDIMFLSMVVTPDNASMAQERLFASRFNVAASRARDRMYLVRSINRDELSKADTLRDKLIRHFETPFIQEESKIANNRELCESGFEREFFNMLVTRGYHVTPQVPVGAYRIDMVVEGESDSRLAIECDGDQYHGPDRWDADMRRQRILERAGWQFWRCFASTFYANKEKVIQDLIDTLTEHNIYPCSIDTPINSRHVEHREVTAFANNDENNEADNISDENLELKEEDELSNPNPILTEPLEDDRVVEIGDIVQYIDMTKPEDVLTIQFTKAKGDPPNGIFNENLPLAQKMIGECVNEEIPFHAAGRSPITYKIIKIHRPQHELTSQKK